MRILIAEDDEGIMSMYELLFRSINHELFTARDGEECLKIFDDEHGKITHAAESTGSRSSSQSGKEKLAFDLVILDYRMPKKNGIEVANHILSASPSQRIIIASAYTHELAESHIAGRKDKIMMLQKPFEFEALLQLVEGNVPQSGSKPSAKRPLLESSEGSARTERLIGSGHLDVEQFSRNYYSTDYFL